MFVTKRDVQRLKDRINSLEDQLITKKEEIADLKHAMKKIDDEAKHLIKMEKERLEIEKTKMEAQIDARVSDKIDQIREEYRDKVEKNLNSQVANVQTTFQAVLDRLPNVNVNMEANLTPSRRRISNSSQTGDKALKSGETGHKK